MRCFVDESSQDGGLPKIQALPSGLQLAYSSLGPPATLGATVVVHVSFSSSQRLSDLRALCDIAAEALPELDLVGACVTTGGVLHASVSVPLPKTRPVPRLRRDRADALYGHVVRQVQRDCDLATAGLGVGETPVAAPFVVLSAATEDECATVVPSASLAPRAIYFGTPFGNGAA